LSERAIMKTSLRMARYGLIMMINYESLFAFVMSIYNGSPKNESPTRYHYDEFIGAPQYLVSFAVVFWSMVTLESATITLLSKVISSPRQVKKYAIDTSFVVTFESVVARVIGDLMVYAFDVSFKDIINCIAFALILAFTAGIYVVRRHFFFLR
jgi:hypothetical protein